MKVFAFVLQRVKVPVHVPARAGLIQPSEGEATAGPIPDLSELIKECRGWPPVPGVTWTWPTEDGADVPSAERCKSGRRQENV